MSTRGQPSGSSGANNSAGSQITSMSQLRTTTNGGWQYAKGRTEWGDLWISNAEGEPVPCTVRERPTDVVRTAVYAGTAYLQSQWHSWGQQFVVVLEIEPVDRNRKCPKEASLTPLLRLTPGLAILYSWC